MQVVVSLESNVFLQFCNLFHRFLPVIRLLVSTLATLISATHCPLQYSQFPDVGFQIFLVFKYLSITQSCEVLNADIDTDEFDATTIGGFINELSNKMPREGAVVVFRNLELTIMKVSRRRIMEVRLDVLPEEDKPEDEE